MCEGTSVDLRDAAMQQHCQALPLISVLTQRERRDAVHSFTSADRVLRLLSSGEEKESRESKEHGVIRTKI